MTDDPHELIETCSAVFATVYAEMVRDDSPGSRVILLVDRESYFAEEEFVPEHVEELGEDSVLADGRDQAELIAVLKALGESHMHAVRALEAEPDAGCMYVVAMAGDSIAVQCVPLTLIVSAPGGEA